MSTSVGGTGVPVTQAGTSINGRKTVLSPKAYPKQIGKLLLHKHKIRDHYFRNPTRILHGEKQPLAKVVRLLVGSL